MKVALKLTLFIVLCGLAAIAHANTQVQVDKAYNGGFSEPDVFIVQDTNRGVVCYLFEDGNGVSSSCFSQKDLKKEVDTK